MLSSIDYQDRVVAGKPDFNTVMSSKIHRKFIPQSALGVLTQYQLQDNLTVDSISGIISVFDCSLKSYFIFALCPDRHVLKGLSSHLSVVSTRRTSRIRLNIRNLKSFMEE
jgi:hypothetical protein